MTRPKTRPPRKQEQYPAGAQEIIEVLEEQRNLALNALALEKAAFARYRKDNPPKAPDDTPTQR